MTAFIILYPNQNLEQIKKNYTSLHLKELETNILFIIDGLTQQEIQSFVDNINLHIDYSCLMNTILEKDIQKNIGYMSGTKEDHFYLFKNGTIEEKQFQL